MPPRAFVSLLLIVIVAAAATVAAAQWLGLPFALLGLLAALAALGVRIWLDRRK
ncbi:hypothetical protein [Szabonella alba]|uniref:Uncharacterized protein n=1 Tax=Szabonella alba TaxID=2804194 RepID=A0A8K0Y1S3_9RHOB|nr:hypothetical protein [Szabonella alba]MBL4918197.1 hypothetical protein [Szabonella alba]